MTPFFFFMYCMSQKKGQSTVRCFSMEESNNLLDIFIEINICFASVITVLHCVQCCTYSINNNIIPTPKCIVGPTALIWPLYWQDSAGFLILRCYGWAWVWFSLKVGDICHLGYSKNHLVTVTEEQHSWLKETIELWCTMLKADSFVCCDSVADTRGLVLPQRSSFWMCKLLTLPCVRKLEATDIDSCDIVGHLSLYIEGMDVIWLPASSFLSCYVILSWQFASWFHRHMQAW